MLNIMRDIPHQDTQPVAHARLLICMFVPFFDLDDLKLIGETWPVAFSRVEASSCWGSRTYPFRLNIAGMLIQKPAAAEETARRNAEKSIFSTPATSTNTSSADDVMLNFHGDDDSGASVIPTNARRLQTELSVKDAFNTFIRTGFSSCDNDCDAHAPTTLLSRRFQDDIIHDMTRISAGSGESAAALSMDRQGSTFEKQCSSRASSLADSVESTTDITPVYHMQDDNASIEPYMLSLRRALESKLTDDACLEHRLRNDATNASVAPSDIGLTAERQHSAAHHIAQEFGVNRKQRLAFYIFSNGLLAQKSSDPPEALRLYIGGGENNSATVVESVFYILPVTDKKNHANCSHTHVTIISIRCWNR